jgi:RAB protein geranylgeranyltransferase component A
MEAANIAQVLMSIFSYGCGVLFESITANNMTSEHFDKINKYIKSFGYNTKYDYVYEDKTMEDGQVIKVPTNLNVWFEELH